MTAPYDTLRAAALAYEPGHGAPRLVAKGRGEIAQRIIAAADAAGVPVHRSAELVSLLMQVDLDRHIPEALYRAVAEVLIWARGIAPERDPRDSAGASHG
jgi:flagellar biosynthesis protein